MTVLVNGLGNIGTTILNLLVRYRNDLKITQIYAVKNFPKEWEAPGYRNLKSKGVKIIRFNDLDNIKDEINYIFETTANTIGEKNKEYYKTFRNLKAAIAQGSEINFGSPYMAGLNDDIIKDKPFITVVSCNTHGILSLLKHYTHGDLSRVVNGDFVIVRRSEDIGNHERLVSGNVVSRNRSVYGTHHGDDAAKLLDTLDLNLNIVSSDITTPSQFMHGIRFNIELDKNETQKNIPGDLVSYTNYFDSNKLFEIGRRDGFQGRIYSHSIVVSNNIIHTGNRVIGWAFIPQEGNTILSTFKAFLIKSSPTNYEGIFNKIVEELYQPEI